MSTTKRSAFTLVEILIVVVIMAVLAAVVIPQFTGSTEDAKASTAEFNVGGLRSVIQTYRAHHAGGVPALDTTNKAIPGLINKTTASGTVSTSGEFGPYLVEMPSNPYTSSSDVKAVATAGAKPVAGDVTVDSNGDFTGGWIYDASTGQIWLDSNVDGEFAW